MDDNKAKGPGQNGKGNRGGNGFSFDEPKRGDRDGRGGRGGDRRGGREGGSGSYRVVNELSALEKALKAETDPGAQGEMKGAIQKLKTKP